MQKRIIQTAAVIIAVGLLFLTSCKVATESAEDNETPSMTTNGTSATISVENGSTTETDRYSDDSVNANEIWGSESGSIKGENASSAYTDSESTDTVGSTTASQTSATTAQLTSEASENRDLDGDGWVDGWY